MIANAFQYNSPELNPNLGYKGELLFKLLYSSVCKLKTETHCEIIQFNTIECNLHNNPTDESTKLFSKQLQRN